MSDPGSIEETIFIAARDLANAHQRAAYLDQACGPDRALRERVERMLNAEVKADQFLANHPLMATPALCAMDGERENGRGAEAVGSTIGHYKLLQQIGEGGCGLVYMAEQEEPIRRRVALKVIKPGMDTRQVIARFEAERQALAMMDHPNIARVLDAGATEAGRPYFVMELVRGIRITDYCDQNNLSTRQRLELFTKVVQAVQHAHQKGIIHRDIKPSNVLITLHDGVPVPKVIDFGIAKALEQKLTDKTLFTQFEQFIGTPAYTSPEQAEMSGLDIDTRSDIYSLGVLLYELLVGQTPFDAGELVHSGLDEMRRIIREQEPARPSTRLSTMVQGEVTTTAERRRVSVPELVHLLKGDLDWIVMKCLEKDRTRRYATANGLAGDIERYLGNEPVTARPPSGLYRFGKLVRRNKLAFAASVVVATTLIAGIVVSTWQAARAHRAEQIAKEEKDSTEAVLKFFRDKVLAAGRPEGQKGGLGKDVTLRQALDAAEAEITRSFTNRPLIEASIRKALGESYHYLGEPTKAAQQLERALMLRWQTLGADHKETFSIAATVNNVGLGKLNLPVMEEALRLQTAKLGPEHRETVATMSDLGVAYFNSGNVDKAAALYEASLRLKQRQLGSRDESTLITMHNLARAYMAQRKVDQALPLFREALKLQKSALAPGHDLTRGTIMNLAVTLAGKGELDEAVQLYEELVEITKTRFGPDHPSTLISLDELALSYSNAKKYDKAIVLWEKLIDVQKTKIGLDHPDTLTAMHGLVGAYWKTGRRAEAVRLAEQTLTFRRAKLGPNHPRTLESMLGLAFAFWELGNLDQAEALYREYLEHKRHSLTAKFELASVIRDRAPTNTVSSASARMEIDELLRDYLTEARSRYTNDAAKLEGCLGDIAEFRFRQGDYAQAETFYRERLWRQRARLDPSHKDVIATTASLGRLLSDWAWAERATAVATGRTTHASSGAPPNERAREAERLLRECLAAHLNGTNSTHWRVDDMKSRLGGALVAAAATSPTLPAAKREAKLSEAEALLLEAQPRLHERGSIDKKYKRDALERLVRLYEAWDKPDKRAGWQQKLDAFDKEKPKSMASPDEGP